MDFLGIDTLFAELILGLGLALVVGNGYAMYQHSQGKRPDVEEALFRPGRARWLLVVGVLMTVWGAASVFA